MPFSHQLGGRAAGHDMGHTCNAMIPHDDLTPEMKPAWKAVAVWHK